MDNYTNYIFHFKKIDISENINSSGYVYLNSLYSEMKQIQEIYNNVESFHDVLKGDLIKFKWENIDECVFNEDWCSGFIIFINFLRNIKLNVSNNFSNNGFLSGMRYFYKYKSIDINSNINNDFIYLGKDLSKLPICKISIIELDSITKKIVIHLLLLSLEYQRVYLFCPPWSNKKYVVLNNKINKFNIKDSMDTIDLNIQCSENSSILDNDNLIEMIDKLHDFLTKISELNMYLNKENNNENWIKL